MPRTGVIGHASVPTKRSTREGRQRTSTQRGGPRCSNLDSRQAAASLRTGEDEPDNVGHAFAHASVRTARGDTSGPKGRVEESQYAVTAPPLHTQACGPGDATAGEADSHEAIGRASAPTKLEEASRGANRQALGA